jgi:hypothetical protein
VSEGVHLHQRVWIGSAQLLAHEREHEPADVGPAAGAADNDIEHLAERRQLLQALLADDAAQAVLGARAGGGHLHRLGDGDVEAARAGQDPPSGLRCLAKDSVLPHCPVPVSVTTFFTPDVVLYHACSTTVFGFCVAEREREERESLSGKRREREALGLKKKYVREKRTAGVKISASPLDLRKVKLYCN